MISDSGFKCTVEDVNNLCTSCQEHLSICLFAAFSSSMGLSHPISRESYVEFVSSDIGSCVLLKRLTPPKVSFRRRHSIHNRSEPERGEGGKVRFEASAIRGEVKQFIKLSSIYRRIRSQLHTYSLAHAHTYTLSPTQTDTNLPLSSVHNDARPSFIYRYHINVPARRRRYSS